MGRLSACGAPPRAGRGRRWRGVVVSEGSCEEVSRSAEASRSAARRPGPDWVSCTHCMSSSGRSGACAEAPRAKRASRFSPFMWRTLESCATTTALAA